MPKRDSERKEAQQIDKTLAYSVKDAGWWGVMAGFGESYLSAFGVLLKATSFQIAMLGALPQLLASLSQLIGVRLTNIFQSRKRIMVTFAALQGMMWLVIIGIAYLTQSVWVLIALACLYFIFGAIGAPSWSSLMGDLVPKDFRGRYFGKRAKLAGIVSFGCLVAAGIVLDQVSTLSAFGAFAVIFTIAFIGRMFSVFYLSRHYEPIVELREPKPYPFRHFLRDMWTDNFGVFTLFTTLMLIAINLASPLFVIYWLNYLHFSYLQFMIVMSAASITSFLAMTYWGSHADSYGNKTTIWASSYVLVSIPLLWYLLAFAPHGWIFPLAITIQCIAGFASAGFDLSVGNFIYDLVEPHHRIRLIAYHNVMRGIGLFTGGVIGGLLAGLVMPRYLAHLFPTGMLFVFCLSALARLIVPSLFLQRISDVKIVKHRPHFLQLVAVRPVQGIMFESIVGMNRTLKQFKQQLRRIEKHLDYWQKVLHIDEEERKK